MSKIYNGVGVENNVPQSRPVPGKKMIKNEAGGYAFDAGSFVQLERFLILGTEGPTYYASEKERTFENYQALLRCLDEDYEKTINMIVDVSDKGRAPKNDPAVFALSVAATHHNQYCRSYAMSRLSKVVRIGTDLFMFCSFIDERRGWGRAVRTGIGKWYNERSLASLGTQMSKYQQRKGWSHRDVLRLAHVKPKDSAFNNAFRWAIGKGFEQDLLPNPILAFELMKTASDEQELLEIMKDPFFANGSIVRETVPTQFLKSPAVWEALLPDMGATALVRNVGNMSKVGVFDNKENVNFVMERLADQSWLQANRIHPLRILVALAQYETGHGDKGNSTWVVNRHIAYALENAFYLAFKSVVPTNKKFLYALDVSGSMTWGTVAGIGGFTPNKAAAAMALVLANTEPNHEIVGFSDRIVQLGIKPGMKLDEAMRRANMNYGSTDASRAFAYAKESKKDIDAFVCITDNESWSGFVHPFVALNMYRRFIDHPVKLVTMAMTPIASTIGDTSDKDSLDVVGFDAGVQELISSFVMS